MNQNHLYGCTSHKDTYCTGNNIPYHHVLNYTLRFYRIDFPLRHRSRGNICLSALDITRNSNRKGKTADCLYENRSYALPPIISMSKIHTLYRGRVISHLLILHTELWYFRHQNHYVRYQFNPQRLFSVSQQSNNCLVFQNILNSLPRHVL